MLHLLQKIGAADGDCMPRREGAFHESQITSHESRHRRVI